MLDAAIADEGAVRDVSRDPRLELDVCRAAASWKGRPIAQLTRRELTILAIMAARPDVVRSRDQILDQAWPDGDAVDRVVDQAIKRLRRKFRAVDPEFDALRTLYGLGYVWRLG